VRNKPKYEQASAELSFPIDSQKFGRLCSKIAMPMRASRPKKSMHPVRLAYQPPANSIFLSEQTNTT
jgi:hypothetical protein